jgi:hypothetical protein
MTEVPITLPELTQAFHDATSLKFLHEIYKAAKKDLFEGVRQIMTFGLEHPVLEAIGSILRKRAITIGSFTHAVKVELDLDNLAVKQAFEDHCSTTIPDVTYKLFYGTFLDTKGHIIEDTLFYKTSDNKLVCTGNLADLWVWYDRFGQFLGNGFEDMTQKQGIYYLYGSAAEEFVTALTGESMTDIGWRGVRTANLYGIPISLSVTTYTPFKGVEIQFPIEHLQTIWELCFTLAQLYNIDIRPCGLTGRNLARILAFLLLGGNDYGTKESTITPNALGIPIKSAPFSGKYESEDSQLEMVRVYVSSRANTRRIKEQELLACKLGFITSVGYLPSATELLKRSNLFPTTKDEESIIKALWKLLPRRITGNHLMVVTYKGALKPGQRILVAYGPGRKEIYGKVCRNRRAWPRIRQ